MYGVLLVALLTFLLSLVASLGGPSRNEGMEADAVAMQMSSWHLAALKKCNSTSCSGGTIDPAGYFPDDLKNADFVRMQRFRSLYDVGTNYVLTFYTGTGINRPDINIGTVSFSFHNRILGETSSNIGVWNRSTQRVELPSSLEGNSSITIPAALANVVPDRSPVLLSHAR